MSFENRHFFISYRRIDSEEYANILNSKLKLTEPSCNVFLDKVKMIGGGAFTLRIKEELSKADLLLLLISPYWNTQEGKSRLHKINDILCREISYALRNGLPILPILIEGAKMPETADLPEDIFVLNQIHAEKLRLATLGDDIENIFTSIIPILSEKDRLEEAQTNRMNELDELMKSDPVKFEEEMQKEVDRLKPKMPQYLELRSISGEGIKLSWINLFGIWKCTADVQGNKLDIEFMIEDDYKTTFTGKLTLMDNLGQIIRESKIKGTWATALDTDKDLFLGFFLSYIDDNQTQEELIIPFHRMVGKSIVGTDSNGVKFVSTNIEPGVEGF